jgi:hypothetical protein
MDKVQKLSSNEKLNSIYKVVAGNATKYLATAFDISLRDRMI